MKEAMKALAIEKYPHEACAFLVGGHLLEVPNIAETPEHEFLVDGKTLLEIEEEHGKVDGFFHSHPGGPDCPSRCDMEAQEALEIPFWICSTDGEDATEPFSFGGPDVLDYVGRPFRHGVTDCYALVRDFYRQELGIHLPSFPRDWAWWLKGGNLYEEHFPNNGFRRIGPEEARYGDLILFMVGTGVKVTNHGAVLLERGLMLHHLSGRDPYDTSRLSRREPAGRWARWVTHYLRHEGNEP